MKFMLVINEGIAHFVLTSILSSSCVGGSTGNMDFTMNALFILYGKLYASTQTINWSAYHSTGFMYAHHWTGCM